MGQALSQVLGRSSDWPGLCRDPLEKSLLSSVLLLLVCSHRDLSENTIQAIPRKAFRGATDLKNL